MTRLDDRLRDGLGGVMGTAAAPDLGALTDEVTRRRRRRDVVRRARTGALAMVVLVGTFAGYLALSRAFDTDGEPTPAVTVGPTPSAVPEPVVEGEDVGIGTNVCGLDRKGGLDIVPGGDREVAWVGYLVADDGTCPERRPERQRWIVAVDATGDELADTWTDVPLVNCPNIDCWPLDATDLDGDGDGELIVTTQFSIQDQGYFAIEAGDGGYSIAPISVAPPGRGAAGLVGGQPLTTSSGGDAGYASWIRCENYPDAPVLVWTSAESVIDGNEPTVWHEVKLRLLDDGMFHIVDTTDLSLPPGQDPGLIRSDAPACGVDFTLV